MDRKILYMGLLLSVTFFWGVTFPVVKVALGYIGPGPFLALRFLAATIMLAFFVRRGKGFLAPSNIKHGMVAGFLLFIGYYFQTVGLEYTSAAASGIITGAYVVILPLMSYLYLKTKVSRMDLFASIIAFGGLILMSLGSLSNLGTELGDLLTLICAVGYAVQIAYVSKHSRNINSSTFTFYQIAAVTIFSTISIPFTPGGLGTINLYVVFAIIFTAIFGSVFGYYVSTVALIYVEPTAAGIIFVAEPIFAALAAVILAHEHLGIYVILGGAVMIMAMFLTSLDKYLKGRRGSSAHPVS
ncbi:MAG: DMT family transporter [Candidatus Thermoplasmatota archaeon]|jgi:drug/metabolite transporter (DMT)-like permease|nr:DMT family transporter [Candidatus Thermoplasmatota archaeon]